MVGDRCQTWVLGGCYLACLRCFPPLPHLIQNMQVIVPRELEFDTCMVGSRLKTIGFGANPLSASKKNQNKTKHNWADQNIVRFIDLKNNRYSWGLRVANIAPRNDREHANLHRGKQKVERMQERKHVRMKECIQIRQKICREIMFDEMMLLTISMRRDTHDSQKWEINSSTFRWSLDSKTSESCHLLSKKTTKSNRHCRYCMFPYKNNVGLSNNE